MAPKLLLLKSLLWMNGMLGHQGLLLMRIKPYLCLTLGGTRLGYSSLLTCGFPIGYDISMIERWKPPREINFVEATGSDVEVE
ncbi:hypothetical protein CTI12_AA304200 [Artemisia annua]|uniref:Uncharacterized protein n=1 Tax=Artemisia annua TaxID=35608 RepID=A0A2U1N5Q6_ARTAN|nr:hypothetical protein CTI12_AA304200 [Artemisia annua]